VIRITIQIEDEQDDVKNTVISAAFDDFDELEESKFIEKARPFDFENETEEKQKGRKKKPIGFGGHCDCEKGD
jgi:hypothetical protein